MSWLRSSPLRSSFTKHRSRDSPPKDADPVACYDSFKKHWQQSYEIISQSLPPKGVPSHDDVLGVVNHVDQMITLLLLELRDFTVQFRHQNQRLSQRDIVVAAQLSSHSYSCLEYLLSENLLDKLYEWSTHTGRFGDAVRLEQLKLYELLISHDSALLAHEPVTRPLLRLLDECAGDIMLVEVQKKLVVLLNHVCVALVQNTELLGLFFRPTATGKNRFIIFFLLIPYLHQEGGVGQQARDALLLCMSLSKKNDEIGNYIAEESHICSVLATCLSGLYSLLPRTLEIESQDWHRLTVDDINDLPSLTQLMNCLEFCNAVAQVVHPLVQKQLLEFLYRGFLVPVMGPALLQTSVDELIAATAYFDLFLRTVTEPGLLQSMIKFLLEENFDDNRILDHLIRRISSQRSTLSLVTLALFETLVDLNCEDVMLELCLGSLAPCSHVMLSQRRRLLRDLDPFGRCTERLLSLAPSCCTAAASSIFMTISSPSTSPNLPSHESSTAADGIGTLSQHQQTLVHKNTKLPSASSESLYSNYYAYLRDARQKIAACQSACSNWSRKYEDEEDGDYEEEEEEGEELDYADDTDIENGNYDDEFYENDEDACVNNNTSAQIGHNNEVVRKNSTDEKVNRIIASFSERPPTTIEKESSSSLVPPTKLTSAEREKLDADIADLLKESFDISKSNENLEMYNGNNLSEIKSPFSNNEDLSTTLNSLSLSGGESSGYESFAFKGSSESTPVNEDYDDENNSDSKIQLESVTTKSELSSESRQNSCPKNTIQDSKNKRRQIQLKKRRLIRRNAVSKDNIKPQEAVDGKPPSVGIFLDTVLKKLELMMDNNVYVNLHLTGLISRLAIYPQPLLQSFLLNHSLVFQPSIKSLFQVLASLKRKIDDFIAKQQEESITVLVEQARVFLISRENRLVNARKNVLEAAAQFPSPKKTGAELVSLNSYSTSIPTSRALEPKRRSLTSSLTQIFRKSISIESQSMPTDSLNHDSFSYIAEEETMNSNNNRNYDQSFWETSNKANCVQNVVICAVIIDEWLKELAAITQEHTIVSWFSAAAASDNSNNY